MKLLHLIVPTILAVAPAPAAAGEDSGEALGEFVEARLAEFHDRRLERLETLELKGVLARKNPYLLKAKGLDSAEAIVKELLDDHLALQESSLFGFLLEQLAIHVCAEAFDGRKSAVEGVDLEFERDGVRYIVSIKSGPNWGNSSSIAKMVDHFRKAKKILGSNATGGTKVVAVNGCCYGRVATEDKGDYLKVCGQRFWELISGDELLYLEIAELIGRATAAPTAAFEGGYAETLSRFAAEFAEGYCDEAGAVRWHDLVEMNSGARR